MRRDRNDESHLSPDALRMRTAIERRLFLPDPPLGWNRRRSRASPQPPRRSPFRIAIAYTLALAIAGLLGWLATHAGGGN
jgi:hypothetical protein